MKKRCEWPLVGGGQTGGSDLMLKYHDTEWGVPQHNDKILFEFLLLDSFQAGLSWSTILNKRQNFKKAFDNFSVKKIAKYDKKKLAQLMGDAGIIRNRLKIEGAVKNAKAFLQIQKEFESFNKYVWQFVGGKPKKNKWKTMRQIPAISKEAETLNKNLKARGFTFVGPTIIYAFMQGAGLVNDHTIYCFRYNQVSKLK
ncbi:DNA-3-methyladenine glycosylase I [Patescibacteria group bacterium]|nr:DNA-3-methyladenine glycosylase I [Patescibacteria group bacterium]